jgi:hypothetical protein
MALRSLLLTLALAAFAAAQRYSGPTPTKPDLIYIQHAQTLVPTELVQAKEDKRSDDTVYLIDGPNSSARTPLALPIFLVKTEKLVPERLILYRLKSADGHREISLAAKRLNADPIHVDVIKLDANLYKLTVYDGLDPGEYALTPADSNLSFCFQVY